MKAAKAYPLGISIFFFFCFIFIFICYFVDCSQVTFLPLIISYLFLFLFFFLNFIALSNKEKDEEFGDLRGENKDLLNILSYFYSYFNLITKVVRFVIFPFLINYYETGYYSFGKKL